MRKNTHYPGARRLCVWLFFGLLANPAAFAADSYLQQLEAEAAATDNTPQPVSPPAHRPNWSQQQATPSEKIDSGLSMRQFEESLKERYYGSYLFYSALNNNKQKVVYQEYQKNGDIEHLRDVIKTQMTN